MNIIKAIIAVFILSFTLSLQAQKVKIKKGIATVDKVDFLKVEKINSEKYFISTLDDEEFLSISIEEFPTGKYNMGTGKEIYHSYSVIKFIDNEDFKESFEVDEGKIKKLILMLYKSKIFVDGKLSVKKINRMIEKYGENVSERRFLTKD